MSFLKKLGNFCKAYQATLIGGLFYSIVIFYPNVAIRYNPAPAISNLKEASGIIEFVRADYPHLRLKLENGDTKDFMFPGDLQGVYMAKWERYYFSKGDHYKAMQGCPAIVKYDQVRYVYVPTPPRVWSVACEKASISFDEINKKFQEKNEFHGFLTSSKGWLFVISSFFLLLALFVELYIERKKKNEQTSSSSGDAPEKNTSRKRS